MGMSCSKNGCDAILCDHYSVEYGYLCSECLFNLLNDAPNDIAGWINPVRKKDFSEIEINREKIKRAFGLKL